MAVINRSVVNKVNAQLYHEATAITWDPFQEINVDGIPFFALGDAQMETFFLNGWLDYKVGGNQYGFADGFDRLRGSYDRFMVTFTSSTNTAGVAPGTYLYYGLQLTNFIPYVFSEAAMLRAVTAHTGVNLAADNFITVYKNGVSQGDLTLAAGAKKFSQSNLLLSFAANDELSVRLSPTTPNTFPVVMSFFFSSVT